MGAFKLVKLRRRKLTLWQEVSIILIIKVTLLAVIWKLCFSDPVEKHLTVQAVQQHFLGT